MGSTNWGPCVCAVVVVVVVGYIGTNVYYQSYDFRILFYLYNSRSRNGGGGDGGGGDD